MTRTSSILSRLIARLTRAAYTHAALSLDDEFEETYSFTRRNPRLILPAGLARENLWRGLYFARRDPPCRVYRLRMTEDEYERICRRVREMYAERERYHYNYLGVAANYFGHHYSTPRRFFCSEFVAEMLERAQVYTFKKSVAHYIPNRLEREIQQFRNIEQIILNPIQRSYY